MISLGLKTVSESNLHEGWRKRHDRRRIARSATLAILSAYARPPLPVTVRLVRVAPRTLDSDNLQGSLKAIRDGVADWLGVDDGNPGILWTYGQKKGDPRAYDVLVGFTPGISSPENRLGEAVALLDRWVEYRVSSHAAQPMNDTVAFLKSLRKA